MTAVKGVKVVVRAGQTCLTKARRGTKRSVVERVRTHGGDPYVFAHEVDAEGNRRAGRHDSGLPRGMQFVVKLTWNRERIAWVMPPFYAEEQ